MTDDYTPEAADRCEQVLVTVVGSLGPWSQRIYLVGGLAPRYLTTLPPGGPPHIGTTDVDMVVQVALDDDFDSYETLTTNLRSAGFHQTEKSFQWATSHPDGPVMVEFLCDTDQVEPGRIYRPKAGTGTKFAAFNVRGANLATIDYTETTITANRLDGGQSDVTVRVAGLLPYAVLKTFAYQDRHKLKDAYDLVYTLYNQPDGPAGAARTAAASLVRHHPNTVEALALLAQRFETIDHDGPHDYATAHTTPGTEHHARLRNEAVQVVQRFLRDLKPDLS